MNPYLSEKLLEERRRQLVGMATSSHLVRLAGDTGSAGGPLRPAPWRRHVGRRLVELGIVLGVARSARGMAIDEGRRLLQPAPHPDSLPGPSSAGAC